MYLQQQSRCFISYQQSETFPKESKIPAVVRHDAKIVSPTVMTGAMLGVRLSNGKPESSRILNLIEIFAKERANSPS